MKKTKKDYICAVPFLNLEIHEHARFLCCASWLKKYLPEDSSPTDAWNSDEAYEIRESILDGSYRHCDSTQCPFLRQIEYFGDIGLEVRNPFLPKADIPLNFENKIKLHKKKELKPAIVQFSFDRTCNLKCPSCRVQIFTANKKQIEEVESTIELIQEQYGNGIETLYITGSGDPFISVGFRNFLRGFDKTKWPNLKKIHLHTNATKWNKKMWGSMKKIHHLVKSCEISIDAATKDTYENYTRLGGDWEELIENLHFISSIPTLLDVKTSFVIQQKNYKEMKMFYDLMLSIFGNKVNVFFGKITNWGTFSDDEFKEQRVWGVEHPEYDEFLREIQRTLPAKQAWTNAQEFLIPQNKLI